MRELGVRSREIVRSQLAQSSILRIGVVELSAQQLVNCIAAIDCQCGAGDPTAGVCEEERDGVRHVLRATEAERVHCFNPVELFG